MSVTNVHLLPTYLCNRDKGTSEINLHSLWDSNLSFYPRSLTQSLGAKPPKYVSNSLPPKKPRGSIPLVSCFIRRSLDLLFWNQTWTLRRLQIGQLRSCLLIGQLLRRLLILHHLLITRPLLSAKLLRRLLSVYLVTSCRFDNWY